MLQESVSFHSLGAVLTWLCREGEASGSRVVIVDTVNTDRHDILGALAVLGP